MFLRSAIPLMTFLLSYHVWETSKIQFTFWFKRFSRLPRRHDQRFIVNFTVMSRNVMSCHVMPRQVMSCHVMSRHATSCHVMSRHVTSCHVMPRHATSCHVISRHVTSCHVESRGTGTVTRPTLHCQLTFFTHN